jgi:hypothetical protein
MLRESRRDERISSGSFVAFAAGLFFRPSGTFPKTTAYAAMNCLAILFRPSGWPTAGPPAENSSTFPATFSGECLRNEVNGQKLTDTPMKRKTLLLAPFLARHACLWAALVALSALASGPPSGSAFYRTVQP